MSILGYHFHRLGLILSSIEALIFCFIFFLSGRFLLIGTGQVDFEVFGTVLLPSGLLLLCLIVLGSYHLDAWRSVQVMAKRLFASAVCGSLLIIVTQYAIIGYRPSVTKIAFCACCSCLVALGARLIGRRLTKLRSRIKPRALILGAGERAEVLWQTLGSGFMGPNVDGFVALEGADGSSTRSSKLPSQRVVGMPGNLAAYAKEHRIQEIVVALDHAKTALPEQDLILCRMSGILVTDSASFLERVTGQVKLDFLESHWLIFSPGFRRGKLRGLAKRCTDIVYGATGLLLTVSVLPFLALLIKLDSRGPVFYRQRRVGLDGKIFEIYKFRTMRQDAEADGQARWAMKDDDRVTKFGHFLRQSRLDELPQFFNVLKGDMSLVGPRPERPEFTADLSEKLPHYLNRHSVRPGITGWAQVHYPYAATLKDARCKLEYDLYYVKNHSLFLDLITLLLTVRVAAGGVGAR